VAHGESTPPLFYVLEWGWTRVFGDGEAGLRSLPALAGLLTVPVAYAIGRRAGQGRVAVGLAAAALALATHYFTLFVLVPQGAWLLWRHPRRRAALAAVGGLAAVGLALLPLLLAQSGNPYDIAGTSLVVRLVQVPKQFLLGYRGPLALGLGVLGALLVLAAAWLLLRRTPPAPRGRALLLAGTGAAGVALPLLAALAGADYLNARNVLPALVPLLAALAVACADARERPNL